MSRHIGRWDFGGKRVTGSAPCYTLDELSDKLNLPRSKLSKLASAYSIQAVFFNPVKYHLAPFQMALNQEAGVILHKVVKQVPMPATRYKPRSATRMMFDEKLAKMEVGDSFTYEPLEHSVVTVAARELDLVILTRKDGHALRRCWLKAKPEKKPDSN